MAYDGAGDSALRSALDFAEQRIEALILENERLRFLAYGDEWNEAIPPLTRHETQCMRMILRHRGCMADRMLKAITPDARKGIDHVKVYISRIRRKLPANIAPLRQKPGTNSQPYTVPDFDALRAFLEGRSNA